MAVRLDSYRLSTTKNRGRLVRGLGWFSVGLGALQLIAPRSLCRLLGIKPRSGLMRLLGVRELANGIGILSQPAEPMWLKARVAGDAMDLALLGAAALKPSSRGGKLVVATAAVAGVTAVDILCSNELSAVGNGAAQDGRAAGAGHARKSLIINRPPEELYALWRNFQDLPRFMRNVVSVTNTDEGRWHWIVKGPGGLRVEWDAEVLEDRPNELISWRSLTGSDVDHRGTVRFQRAPGGRGTILRVELTYRPPAGAMGVGIAKLIGGSPQSQISADLLRLKQLVETGEIARTEGQSAGRARSTSRVFDDLVRA